MIFATYNMFGSMKGNTVISNLISHYYFYLAKSIKKIKEKAKDLSKTLNLIKDSSAEALCINEVIYDIQKKPMINSLKSLGYKSISIDRSSYRNNSLDLCTILALKQNAREIPIKITKNNSPVKEGSACSLYDAKENITLIGVHLALSKKIRSIQLMQISEFIKNEQKKGRKIIIMGDFNDPLHKIQKHEKFKELKLISKKIPTYPTFKFFRWIKRDYDHIFHSQSHVTLKTEIKSANSDHFMLKHEIVPREELINRLNTKRIIFA